MIQEQRRADLSGKLLEMGRALVKEGVDSQDGCVITTGTSLLLISNIITSEDDMFMFGELCAMFSAKKVLEDMDKNKHVNDTQDDFLKTILEKIKDVASKDLPKKVRKPRRRKGDNGDQESS